MNIDNYRLWYLATPKMLLMRSCTYKKKIETVKVSNRKENRQRRMSVHGKEKR